MNKCKWLFAVAILAALSVMPATTYADLAWVSPTVANNSHQSSTTITINVSSTNFHINSSATVFEWTNQSNEVANVTPTSVQNTTGAAGNYSYLTVTAGAGRHRFKAYINQSANTTHPGINHTFAQGQTRNITIDSTLPTGSITDPTNGTQYKPKQSATNQTIHFNFTAADADPGTRDTCMYDILGEGGTGVFSTFTANTTVSCTIVSLGITPRNGGASILELYVNDTAGNINRFIARFEYAVTQVGGGSSGGAVYVPPRQQPPIQTGQPSAVMPRLPQQPRDYTWLWTVVGLLAVWYMFFRKKKRR